MRVQLPEAGQSLIITLAFCLLRRTCVIPVVVTIRITPLIQAYIPLIFQGLLRDGLSTLAVLASIRGLLGDDLGGILIWRFSYFLFVKALYKAVRAGIGVDPKLLEVAPAQTQAVVHDRDAITCLHELRYPTSS